jgi:hypothetical protein
LLKEFNALLTYLRMPLFHFLRHPDFGNPTYYSADKGCLRDCSLPVEMMYPGSINGIDIETPIGATNSKMGKKSMHNSPFPFDASTATPFLTSFLIQAWA